MSRFPDDHNGFVLGLLILTLSALTTISILAVLYWLTGTTVLFVATGVVVFLVLFGVVCSFRDAVRTVDEACQEREVRAGLYGDRGWFR